MAIVKWETNLETLEDKAYNVSGYTGTDIYVDQQENGLYSVFFPDINTDKEGLSFFDAYYLIEGYLFGVINYRRNNG
jgi:hypothetical protein